MNAERRTFSLAGREKAALAIIALVVLILLGGLVNLQVFRYSEFSAQSEKNRIRVLPLVPRRGRVYDREHRVIIDNRPSYTVSVIPAEEVSDVTVPNLAELIGLDTTEVRRRIKKNIVSRFQPSAVKKDIPFEVVAVLEEQNEKYPGVSYQMERVRQYRHELGAESFTGYVGEVSSEEMQTLDSSVYRPGSMIGKKGLEREYDQSLRGQEGTMYLEVYASGQILGPYRERPPVQPVVGNDLILSIDNDLQLTATQALDTFCCGAIVALDPRNGEILAMTSYPTYDANIFSSVIPEDLWQEISNDTTHPLLNRPLVGLYPPGSTVKFVAVGAALEEGLVTPETRLSPCTGGFPFGNRVFHCWELGGHGSLNAVQSLERSCDVYLYQVGLKLGIDTLSQYYDMCGFGYVTDVDLPNEASGLNPDSKYYDERYGKRKWTRGLVLNNAIGQGELLVTPLQLARFIGALVNGGVAYKPHIVKEVVASDGSVRQVPPQPMFTLPFSQSTLRVLNEGLRMVVEGEHGTARSLRNKDYSVGGKTGTAQNPHGENHSWFVGVAPLENPEIVVCAIVENAGHGSEVAAPVVGRVIRRYMEKKLNLPPRNAPTVAKPVAVVDTTARDSAAVNTLLPKDTAVKPATAEVTP